MSLISVDIEADGPIPGEYSMIAIGAVIVNPGLGKTFSGRLKPISTKWMPDSLRVSGFTREQTETFDEPYFVMDNFKQWIHRNSPTNPVFISDNNGFDWMFVCWYFIHFLGENPFGFSSRRIGDLYCGMKGDLKLNQEWKRKLRKTKHTHNPLDDAIGNAEALISMEKMGLKGIL